jgi:adenine-specific DNA-methyltransferase
VAASLYVQQKVHPTVIIDDLRRETKERAEEAPAETIDLFADFNGLTYLDAKTECYRQDQHWSNRMISGESLSVMASLGVNGSEPFMIRCWLVHRGTRAQPCPTNPDSMWPASRCT